MQTHLESSTDGQTSYKYTQNAKFAVPLSVKLCWSPSGEKERIWIKGNLIWYGDVLNQGAKNHKDAHLYELI